MKGEVVYLYAFDVANEIATRDVREILSVATEFMEIRPDSTYPKDVPLYRPLAVSLPELPTAHSGRQAKVVVHIFDVGVVNVALRLEFEAGSLNELLPLHNPRLANGESFDQEAGRICAKVCESLKPHLIRWSPPSEPEAYTVFIISGLGEDCDAATWLARQRSDVAGLLTETPVERLSDAQVDETLRISRSFTKTDLVVIDWDASLVIDADGYVEDVLYVLELANLQLEEFRVIDRRLDRYLDQAYQDVERHRYWLVGSSARMLRSLRRLRMDVAKLTDEVSHITKFLGDWHLARIYLGARDRFYLEQWRHSAEERLAQLDELYSVFHAESNERRMLWLEVAIVVLFVIDILAIFLWKH